MSCSDINGSQTDHARFVAGNNTAGPVLRQSPQQTTLLQLDLILTHLQTAKGAFGISIQTRCQLESCRTHRGLDAVARKPWSSMLPQPSLCSRPQPASKLRLVRAACFARGLPALVVLRQCKRSTTAARLQPQGPLHPNQSRRLALTGKAGSEPGVTTSIPRTGSSSNGGTSSTSSNSNGVAAAAAAAASPAAALAASGSAVQQQQPGSVQQQQLQQGSSQQQQQQQQQGASQQQQQQQPPGGPPPAFSLKPVYVLIFGLVFLGGLLFASMSLQLTSDLGFSDALTKVVRRIFRSIAFRQLLVITACMLMVRFALNSVLRLLAKWSASPVQWDKSKLYYVMKEVYSPLELLLFIAGCCTIADSFVPQLINVPKATVTHVVRAVLSVSFVIGASVVVYNLKSRFCKEQAWQMELQGDITSQRRWEAYDKLGTFGIYAIGLVLAIQALGLEVRSVLAIGGIGGLAIGLAGREICENLLNGMLLMTTMPFEVGEEVCFRPNGQLVEGIVVDVGWYRTLIRSFEREMYVIPNAVFSKNTVLNVTRKQREWRFYEFLCVRVQDVHKVNAIIQDIRRIVRNDSRIINKLHRRVFMDKISLDDVKVYVSFYCEASNRDAFMAIKQDLLLAFVDCVERNGAKLAQPRTVLEVDQESLLPRLMAGLLPGPGGSSGGDFGLNMMGYGGGRNGSGGGGAGGMPITVQVVDAVDSVERRRYRA
ncbi:Mechanosensitive ion channel-domain-containing protein [Scenedesmus sp. NREL 46B-D3]|nr:Mechanosensitive ion channel-domain-containing protein [Scenedesmus sp. NREL 46B-D3]